MRIPRPTGTTNLNLQLIQGGKEQEERKRKIHEHILKHCISSSFHINGKPTTLPELRRDWGIEEEDALRVMLDVAPQLIGLTQTDTPDQVIRALGASVLIWAQEDRKAAITQLSLLAESQGDGYKAFISSEVTKALKVSQEATTNMMKAIQVITGSGPGGGTTINILNQNQQANQSQEAFGPHQALELLQQEEPKGPLLGYTPEAKAYLEERDDIPEVNARMMESENLIPRLGKLTTDNLKNKALRQAERDDQKEGSLE